MGWLKPAESLLEPKAIWEDTHRDPPPDGPVPEPAEGVTADGQTVCGVRIGAAGALQVMELDLEQRKSQDCLPEEFVLHEREFDFVPVALLVGVPLMFKRLPMGEGDDAEELRYETKMYVYRLMTTPGLGLPITWNQNGEGTKLPPVLACRSDGVPFTPADWACLCEFHEYLDEKYVRGEQLWYTNKQEFKKWVGIWVRGRCFSTPGDGAGGGAPSARAGTAKDHAMAFADINPCLEHRFPIGLAVRAVGLAAKPELNGRVGTVVKYDEARSRVGVEFAAPHGLLSLKHTNLEMGDGGQARSKMLLEAVEKRGRRREHVGPA